MAAQVLTALARIAYSPREVAQMLGCSHQTVLRLVANGKLAKLDTGDVHRTLIPKSSIEAYTGETIDGGAS